MDVNRAGGVCRTLEWGEEGTVSHGVQRGFIIAQVRDGGGLDAGAGSVDGETHVGRRAGKSQ